MALENLEHDIYHFHVIVANKSGETEDPLAN